MENNNNDGAYTEDASDAETIVNPWDVSYPHQDISERVTRQTVNNLIERRIGPGELDDISRLKQYINRTMLDFGNLSLLLHNDGHSGDSVVEEFIKIRDKFYRSEGGTDAQTLIDTIIDTHNGRTKIFDGRSDYGAASRSFLESPGRHEDVVNADNIRRANKATSSSSEGGKSRRLFRRSNSRK